MIALNINEKLTLIISLIGLLVSIATFFLGLFAYKKFLSNKLVESQLSIVLELIEEIHKNVIDITTVHKPKPGYIDYTYIHKNLFQLAQFSDSPETSKINYPILFPISHAFTFKPWVFLNNPLLPNQIASKLSEFHACIIMIGLQAESLNTYAVLGKVVKELTIEDAVSLSEYEGGIVNFIKKMQRN